MSTLTIRIPPTRPRMTFNLLEAARDLSCRHEGTQPDNDGNLCHVFTLLPGVEDHRVEIPIARPFPVSRLRDLVADHLRNNAPI